MTDQVFEMRVAELDTLKVGEWIGKVKTGMTKVALPGYEIDSITLTISASPSAAIKFTPKKPPASGKKR
jgi:hypothetical protein